ALCGASFSEVVCLVSHCARRGAGGLDYAGGEVKLPKKKARQGGGQIQSMEELEETGDILPRGMEPVRFILKISDIRIAYVSHLPFILKPLPRAHPCVRSRQDGCLPQSAISRLRCRCRSASGRGAGRTRAG